MTRILMLAGLTLLLCAPFVVLVIASRKERTVRGLAVVMFLLAWLATCALGELLLGRPLPSQLMQALPWEPHGSFPVLGYKAVTDVAIYLLVDQGGPAPRLVMIPWSSKTADQLQQAQEDGTMDKERLMMEGRGKGGVRSWGVQDPSIYEEAEPPVEQPKPDNGGNIEIPGETL